ncbi:MAG TPA: tRNA (adenosine(37)-N6)-threonylcarbamoyltransferase complex transferase subunit TsaD [Thermoanaerobaculia bacterium]|nr:tRNA (adenosine(37)-N6)-threonylcarbamoyltransferase complex transferase subunit TsaD [Thermoanaerobaculia bacterium]
MTGDRETLRSSPLVLGIETSCDDTACAVVDGAGAVLSSVVSSQLEAHREWGGVVPEIASREHLRNWPAVSAEALERAGVGLDSIEAVAATRGPGLVGSLLVGLSIGRAIAWSRGLPFYGVHHLEAHLYSPWLRGGGEPAAEPPDRFVGLVVSGGHTLLVEAESGGRRLHTVAETRDDAMGEVFDKVGKRLGLAFPAGPAIDALAEKGHAGAHPMPIGSCGDSLDFSFSGLKSRALLHLNRLEQGGIALEPENPAVLDLLAGFRAAAVGQLVDRVARLHAQRPFATLAVSGGVAANRLLRRALAAWAERTPVDLRLVSLAYCGDNAAMVAHAALRRHRRGEADDPTRVDAASRIALEVG